MLILSRRADEKVVFPSLGISVTVLRSNGTNIKLGIDAPREIAVVRGELIEKDAARFSTMAETHAAQGNREQPTVMRTKIHNAAETLNRLHAVAESADWAATEHSILELFNQLKSLDQDVAELSNTAKPTHGGIAIPNGATSQSGCKTTRALLVDDSENESRLLSSYLQIKGVEVSLASNGEQAMKKLQEESLDVVLLDMNMPEFDGRWTINRIRHNRQFDDLTVFAVSGTAETESDVEVGPNGVNSWFQKPLNPEKLVSAITKQMDTIACVN